MTAVRVSLVDVYVLRGSGASMQCLLLRRAPGDRCPGSWETVHGHIEDEELPADAALRELEEETGLKPDKLYNLSRVESFYLHAKNEVALIPAFVAMVGVKAEVRPGSEHDDFRWVDVGEALTRLAWPRERRAVEDAVALFGTGDAGSLEDVLRVC
jgi:dihydroneopterin triphosphate diphosphatase